MAGGLVLAKRSPDEVPAAPDGKVRIFVDETGAIALVDDTGTVVSMQAILDSLTSLVATKQNAATAATDSELASAVSTLTAAISGKQDAATAATDAELASAVTTLNTALAAKQDASTAATHADLSAAIEGVGDDLTAAINELQTALAAKQDTATAATDAELTAGLAAKQSKSEKGQAEGYAPLDNAGHVPAAFMPVGALTYKGAWDAATNTPTLSDGTGSVGQQYAITVAGTRNLGSGSVEFKAGAVLLHNGTIWQQIASPNDVASVFGRKGAIAAQSGDYAIGQISGAGTAAAKDSGSAGTAGKVLDADDPVLPTPGQKNALAGNDGTPGTTNPFLTKQSLGAAGATGKALKADDPTTGDSRTPKAHAASHGAAGADPLALTAAQVTDLGNAAVGTIGIDVPSKTEHDNAKTLLVKRVPCGDDGKAANTARPASAVYVEWICAPGITPVNAIRFDTIIQDATPFA
jgi:hypothetical protein